ncbi:hypothetical protein MP638_002379 [Amoeboaphelidium occidentale]|nr:hypothetical protein MP638_002379 [Amoeboaphelidium occidentale]
MVMRSAVALLSMALSGVLCEYQVALYEYFIRSSVNAVAGDGAHVYYGGYQGRIFKTEWKVNGTTERYAGNGDDIFDIVLSYDPLKYYTAGADRTVRSYYSNGTLDRVFSGHTDDVFALSLNDRYIYSASADNSVRQWNYDDGTKGWNYSVPSGVTDIASHGEFLYVAAVNGSLIRLDINEGTANQTLQAHDDAVTSISIYDDFLVTGSVDDTFKVWNLERMEMLAYVNVSRIVNCVYASDKYVFVAVGKYVEQYFYDGQYLDFYAPEKQNVTFDLATSIYAVDGFLFVGYYNGFLAKFAIQDHASYEPITETQTSDQTKSPLTSLVTEYYATDAVPQNQNVVPTELQTTLTVIVIVVIVLISVITVAWIVRDRMRHRMPRSSDRVPLRSLK